MLNEHLLPGEQAGLVRTQQFFDVLFPTDYAFTNQSDAPNAALVGMRDGMDEQVLNALLASSFLQCRKNSAWCLWTHARSPRSPDLRSCGGWSLAHLYLVHPLTYAGIEQAQALLIGEEEKRAR